MTKTESIAIIRAMVFAIIGKDLSDEEICAKINEFVQKPQGEYIPRSVLPQFGADGKQ